MRFVTDIESATGASAKDVSNWLARMEFRTQFEETRQGRARRYTLENALEIAFVDACSKGGVRPSIAIAIAHALVRECMSSRNVRPWMVFAAGDGNKGKRFEVFNPASILEIAPQANAFSLIPVSEIHRRVKAYFEVHAEEVEA